MYRVTLFVLMIAFAASLCGCGGGSGTKNGTDTGSVSIQQFTVFNHPAETRTEFVPMSITIAAGVNHTITWINQTPGRHQIVSGILTPQGDVSNRHLITINFGNFTPDELSVNAGDTIQFSNLSGRDFTMQVVDTNGTVVSTFTIPTGGMLNSPPTVIFPGPGVWIVQSPDRQQIATITLFGNPVADGNFQSGVMSPGNVYQKAFPVPGTFPYFDLNPDDPSHVYATGVIVVQ
jgi:plastocyanin